MYVFEVRLADTDRGVYEALTIRAARHPSESEEFLVTRLVAYCLEYTTGIAFSKGLSDPDEPAITVRDLTGALQAWVEVGTPDATRVHKAAKAAPAVSIYVHRDVEQFLARLQGERIHRADVIRIRYLERELLAALVQRLGRRMDFDLAVSDRTMYFSFADETLSGTIEERQLREGRAP
jgi:uncharacterized protein YaeQ